MKVKVLRNLMKNMRGDDLVLFEIPKSNGDCEELEMVDYGYEILIDENGEEKPSLELMMDYKEKKNDRCC
jgi:hypothetical protein